MTHTRRHDHDHAGGDHPPDLADVSRVDLPNTPREDSHLPTGWVTLLRDTIAALDRLVPGWQVIQLKESHAGARLHIALPPATSPEDCAKATRLLWTLTAKSYETCDVCGAPGDVFDPHHPEWDERRDACWRTRCETHRYADGIAAHLHVTETCSTKGAQHDE